MVRSLFGSVDSREGSSLVGNVVVAVTGMGSVVVVVVVVVGGLVKVVVGADETIEVEVLGTD
jgi:hypothetical protein